LIPRKWIDEINDEFRAEDEDNIFEDEDKYYKARRQIKPTIPLEIKKQTI
jgi:hypothetical protein